MDGQVVHPVDNIRAMSSNNEALSLLFLNDMALDSYGTGSLTDNISGSRQKRQMTATKR
jgi:hypothetical protein